MITIPIDDKDKKKKEQQRNTQPAQPAPTEQTTTTATTTEQPQQPQGPVLWKTKDEEINFNNELFDTYLKNYEPRENAIQQEEKSYFDKMNKMYGLINQNSEKTKEALKKQPIADAFNMLGTAVGKLSEVASNATFSGRVAPKKVDSSDIAKQGNALLKKSYELPQYLQAIDNDIIKNKAKQLQNEYAVNMNRLQRQMQYIQNALEKATTKTEKEYLSAEAYNLKQQELALDEWWKKQKLDIANRNATANIIRANNEGNDLADGYSYLRVEGKRYKVSDYFIDDVLNSNLFTPEERKKLTPYSYDRIRGQIQDKLDAGIIPTKDKDGNPFAFKKALQGMGKELKRTY